MLYPQFFSGIFQFLCKFSIEFIHFLQDYKQANVTCFYIFLSACWEWKFPYTGILPEIIARLFYLIFSRYLNKWISTIVPSKEITIFLCLVDSYLISPNQTLDLCFLITSGVLPRNKLNESLCTEFAFNPSFSFRLYRPGIFISLFASRGRTKYWKVILRSWVEFSRLTIVALVAILLCLGGRC